MTLKEIRDYAADINAEGRDSMQIQNRIDPGIVLLTHDSSTMGRTGFLGFVLLRDSSA